ncbi:MAG: hypothetical protein ACK42H_01720, partial [Planctomycetota bacterium]
MARTFADTEILRLPEAMSYFSIQTATSTSKWRYQKLLKLTLAWILIAALGWFGLRLIRAWVQEHEVLALRRIEGCRVKYAGEDTNPLDFLTRPPVLPPVSWPEALFGKHFVHRDEFVEWPAARFDEAIAHIKQYGHNPHYIQSIEFDKSKLEVTSDLQSVIDACDYLVIAIPSAFVHE